MSELNPVSEMEWKDLMIEYMNFTFTGTTEVLVKNLEKNRFQEVYDELQRRKDERTKESA